MPVRNWKIGDIINIKAVVSLLYGIVIGGTIRLLTKHKWNVCILNLRS